MMVIQDDITEVDERVELLEGDVDFLFDETVIQDERLLNLERETEEIDEQLVLIGDDLESKFLKCCVTFWCLSLNIMVLTKLLIFVSVFV